MKKINFVMAIDSQYVKPSIVTITSILINLNKSYRAIFYIFSQNIKFKPTEFKKLEQHFNCSIVWINAIKYKKIFNQQNTKGNQNSWVSLATYYRLLMFKFLPKNVKQAIYIDGDIVVDNDLSVLYKKFIKSGNMFSAVADIAILKDWKNNKKYYSNFNEFKKLVNFPQTFAYFCAGFYIANIEKCKKKQAFELMMNFLKKNPNPKLADQDVLNAIIGQKFSNFISYLHPKYNVFMDSKPIWYWKNNKFFYKRNEIMSAFRNPIIYHYAGSNKPWNNITCRYGSQKWWRPEKWWYYHDKSIINMKRPQK